MSKSCVSWLQYEPKHANCQAPNKQNGSDGDIQLKQRSNFRLFKLIYSLRTARDTLQSFLFIYTTRYRLPRHESQRRTHRMTLFSRTESHHVVMLDTVSISQMKTTSHHFKHDSVELGYFDIISTWMKDWQANTIILPDIPQVISS
jgi:hypothetical protein